MSDVQHSEGTHRLRAGMVGAGMIFDETYRPFFEGVRRDGLYDRRFGLCEVELAAVATRTGKRAKAYKKSAGDKIGDFKSFADSDGVPEMLKEELDFVCVATPDDRHFEPVMKSIEAGRHVIVEKPSVLSLVEVDELTRAAEAKGVLAKVVYHKLLDPDHKKLRTLVVRKELEHVNTGYCSLFEPKVISGDQFSEWIQGRNPGTYVAVHYVKLIDFTFGGKLKSVSCTGQRGIVGPADGDTWDSTQLRLVYEYEDGREATFDIHTSWVTPDNFPGYVDQEVHFRFDNGVWSGHARKRGVECTIEGKTPFDVKVNINNHYNADCIEPDGRHTQRGYGVEVVERFAREVAYVEYGGPAQQRDQRLREMRNLTYNDLSADRQVVAAVHAMEEILRRRAAGVPDCVVHVNTPEGGLVLYRPGSAEPEILYANPV